MKGKKITMDSEKNLGDEEFISIMGASENEETAHENNISDGYIIIHEERIPFGRKAVFDGKMSVIIPETFELMPEETAAVKYPSAERPDFIYTNEETTVNFSLAHKDGKAANEDIPGVKDMIQEFVAKMHPASAVIDSEVIEVSGKNIAYFDFVAPAIDTEVYNMMFVFSLEGRLAIGSFNCPIDDMEDWKPVFVQMMQSIEQEG